MDVLYIIYVFPPHDTTSWDNQKAALRYLTLSIRTDLLFDYSYPASDDRWSKTFLQAKANHSSKLRYFYLLKKQISICIYYCKLQGILTKWKKFRSL